MKNITNIVKDYNLFGRKKLYASLDPNKLDATSIANVLKVVLPIHKKNASQIAKLREIEKGNQSILEKTKEYNVNFNNIVVENHISHAVSFKKGYVFGYQSQYVPMSDKTENLPPNKPDTVEQGFDSEISQDISKFNAIMRENDKASLDIDLAEDLYICGVGTRLFVPNKETFELYNLDPSSSFVVYSNGYRKSPLFAVYMVLNTDYATNKQILELKVYTNSKVFNYKLPYDDYDKQGSMAIPEYVKPNKPTDVINALGFIPIVEYELNKNRISLVERMITIQDALNTLSSNEVDDVERFVNSLMVFINADIDEETLDLARKMGAINIKSSVGQDGDVKLLSSKLDHVGVKVLYDKLLYNMLINVGVPLVNTGGGGGGSTGLARLTDNGWLMADTKAREDELSFAKADKTLLTNALKYLNSRNVITKLEAKDIETKFTRNKSDNILVKTQALTNLRGIMHPEDAFAVVDLLSDPTGAVARARDFFGEDFFKTPKKEEIKNDIQTDKVEEVTED